MKGILLAGGSGSRLHPLTAAGSKQLLPVYDKPMVYYPLSTLMSAGIREILLISTPHDLPRFRALLKDGHHLGLDITYAEQPRPEGLAQAFIIGASFIGSGRVALALGDNIFYGHKFSEILQQAVRRATEGAMIFGYHVRDPERYGVVTFDANMRAIDLEEKPKAPKSSYAVPGLYFYDNDVVAMARGLKPSARGELEITDINLGYLRQQRLHVERLGRGVAWLDTGTPKALLDAANFIHVIEERQALKVGCIEEVAYRMGYIDSAQFEKLAQQYVNSSYGRYLLDVLST